MILLSLLCCCRLFAQESPIRIYMGKRTLSALSLQECGNKKLTSTGKIAWVWAVHCLCKQPSTTSTAWICLGYICPPGSWVHSPFGSLQADRHNNKRVSMHQLAVSCDHALLHAGCKARLHFIKCKRQVPILAALPHLLLGPLGLQTPTWVWRIC